MNFLRAMFGWIGGHRIFTILLIACALAGIWYVRRSYMASSGQLSAPLSRGTIAETVYGIGTIVAKQSLQIRPGQVAHLDRYLVREGDTVSKGEPLVTLDGITWRAPFSGTITNLPFKNGENVYAQGPILTMTDLTDRYMTVSLEQQGALRVKDGQKARISFDTIRDETYEGIVSSVYSNEAYFIARIDLPPRLPKRILPGMTADVAIIISVHENVLLAPVAGLSDGKVWVKREGQKPERVDVTTGINDKDLVEIVSGPVSEGDRIIIKGKAQP